MAERDVRAIFHEDYVMVRTDIFDLFRPIDLGKTSAAGLFLQLALRSDENASVYLHHYEHVNEEALSVLCKEGLVDAYRYFNRYQDGILVVVRPNDFTDVGSDYVPPRVKIASKFYGNTKRREQGYQEFRRKVLKRDNYQCVDCGADENLEVHHIKEYVNYPKLRTTVSNGVTLCTACHKKRHKKAVRRRGNL